MQYFTSRNIETLDRREGSEFWEVWGCRDSRIWLFKYDTDRRMIGAKDGYVIPLWM